MPQSLRYAWRWLIGASAAAMLIASMPAAASAKNGAPPLITLCVNMNGRIGGIDIHCKPRQIQLTWNIQGPTGPQGAVGQIGMIGSQGAQGDSGPTGAQGPTGAPGLPGNTGPVGTVGLKGLTGTPGTNGDNIGTLTGGTLGSTVGGNAEIQLATGPGSLFMAPGNAASFKQTSVQVPTPGGEAFHLQVAVDNTPGNVGSPAAAYTFAVCDENVCTVGSPGVSCVIAAAAVSCFDDTDEVAFNTGDTISILAFNSVGTPNTVDVGWSLDFAPASDAFGNVIPDSDAP